MASLDEELENILGGDVGGGPGPEEDGDPMAGGDLSQYPYMDYTDDEYAMIRFQRLRGMKISPSRAIDWDALRAVGEEERARALIPEHSPWGRYYFVVIISYCYDFFG